MVIREYCPTDCKELTELFYNTVHVVNAKDYTKEQLDVWAARQVDLKKWDQSLQEHFSIVAVDDGIIVGFGDVDKTGYLDRLYVHSDYQGKGIATAICNKLESAVQENIVTHASITARPFFEKRGYKIVKEQQVERQGIFLTNFVMMKERTMVYDNFYFINGTAYAGKSTMIKRLAEKHNGIACEENYHDRLLSELDSNKFPCLTYMRDLQDWHDFIRRTPDVYEAWYDGVSKECEILELQILNGLVDQGKKVFVDTNISIETLRKITPNHHVLIMLADPETSVGRFFERPDREKQFLYQLILEEPDPDRAMDNFRRCLMRINSQERHDAFLHAGFQVVLRDDNRTLEETLSVVEKCFGLIR